MEGEASRFLPVPVLTLSLEYSLPTSNTSSTTAQPVVQLAKEVITCIMVVTNDTNPSPKQLKQGGVSFGLQF